MIQATDEESDFNLGTWEGNPLDMFGSLFTGVDVKDVVIYGQGIADGMAPDSDWWVTPRIKRFQRASGKSFHEVVKAGDTWAF